MEECNDEQMYEIIEKINTFKPKERQEMFDVILESRNILTQGFDWLDGEILINWFSILSSNKKKELYNVFGYIGNDEVYEFINSYWQDDRLLLWREIFKRLSKKEQIVFLQDIQNIGYYIGTKFEIENKYNWNDFLCTLEMKEEVSQLKQIKSTWCDLGMQVYGCKENNKGKICPCLRHSSNTSAWKCFKDYLQNKGLNPNGKIPVEMLIG